MGEGKMDEGKMDESKRVGGRGLEEEGRWMRVGSAGCKVTVFLRDGQANSVGL